MTVYGALRLGALAGSAYLLIFTPGNKLAKVAVLAGIVVPMLGPEVVAMIQRRTTS
jgi:hypothetical protein